MSLVEVPYPGEVVLKRLTSEQDESDDTGDYNEEEDEYN
jgi:hypothetical protein